MIAKIAFGVKNISLDSKICAWEKFTSFKADGQVSMKLGSNL